MIRHASCLWATWGKRLFAIEVPNRSDLVYFSLSDPLSSDGENPAHIQQIFSQGKIYSFSVAACNRIQTARTHRKLKSKLLEILPTNCQIMGLLSFCPDIQDSLEKGFLVQDTHNSPETERLLKCLLRENEQYCFCTYEKDDSGRIWQSLGSLSGRGTEVCRTCVFAAREIQTHPCVLNIKNSAVFYAFEDAYSVLQECKEIIPEAKDVLDLAEQCTKKPLKGDFPVIAIEGLDATGKTTLTLALKDSLNAALLRSPPSCISQWRKTFDDEPTLIKRAFYAVGNYITASEIAKQSSKSPVIVDRYWHSTAAYAIATEVGGKVQHLPAHHHEVFQWPSDLLKPDLVLLLTVSPEERVKRMQGRGQEKTKEETELEANNLFRQKVEEAYRRMENPSCIVVDSSPSKEEVLRHVLFLIRKHCGLL